MKTKHLFYSIAMAAAFSACTQEELMETPALESNVAAERPVAGVVTFVNDEVESRYDSEKAKFENGDQMGLYLMDEFSGYGELANANDTYWNWQSSWWKMYNMVDYINTNYGYVYNAETGEWINRASQLIEGNYIALFPQNTRATNRRDLWHPIKANVDLVDHSSTPRYYVNRENQFFVGYEQIKRDEKAGEETGELRADISMKPIMTYAKMYFENQAANDFKIQKVVFKAHGGKALPNVAYVKPAGIKYTDNDGHVAPWWAWTNGQCTAALQETYKDDCENLLAWSKYDRTTYNQKAARLMVQYASTSDGQIPYGMTEEEAMPVYEYVFNFPEDADILKGHDGANSSTERVCGISIALPAFDGWKNMEVVVYGEMFDPTINFPEGGWRPGIIKKLKNVDNAEFKLDKLKEWEQGYDIPTVTARIDDNYFYQENEIRVSTTKDLYDLINARLSSASDTEDIHFNVQHYGNGLAITDEVVKLITDYENDNNVDVAVTFNNQQDHVTTPVILEAANSIDMFEYVGVNVVVEAPQTITDVTVDGINELRNFSTIKVDKKTTTLTAANIVNEAGAVLEVVNNANVNVDNEIHNEGTVNLKGAIVTGKIVNEAVLNSDGTTTVTSIINDNNCINCGKDEAILTVLSGTLTVNETLENSDKVVVEKNAALVIANVQNNGTININGSVTVTAGENGEKGTINIEADAKLHVDTTAAGLDNLGTINVKGSLMQNIKNSGYVYVIDNGKVIVNGSVNGKPNGIIDITKANDEATSNAAKDLGMNNYYRYTVNEEKTSNDLVKSLEERISSLNWGINKIILVWGENSATTFCGEKLYDKKIARVIINNNLTFVKTGGTSVSSFGPLENRTNAVGYVSESNNGYNAFQVNGTVIVDNYAELFVESDKVGGDDLNLWISKKASLKANNQSKLSGGSVKVAGEGLLIVETANCTWDKSSAWNGEWHQ